MKTLTAKILRVAVTLLLVLIAAIAIFRAWSFYTESPWTRDAQNSPPMWWRLRRTSAAY